MYLQFAEPCGHAPTAARKRIRKSEAAAACTKWRGKLVGELSRGLPPARGTGASYAGRPGYSHPDEPTSGLDPNQIVEIRQLIKEE